MTLEKARTDWKTVFPTFLGSTLFSIWMEHFIFLKQKHSVTTLKGPHKKYAA